MTRLTKCKICGNEVSSNAKTCPVCGYKVPFYHRLWFWILVIVILAIVIYYLLPINHVIGFNLNCNGNNQPSIITEETSSYESHYDYGIEETITYGKELEEYYYVDTLLYANENDYINRDLLLIGTFVSNNVDNNYFVVTGIDTSVEYSTAIYVHYDSDTYSDIISNFTYGDEISFYCSCYYCDSEYGYGCQLTGIY